MENDRMRILAVDDNADNLTILKALISEAFPQTEVLCAYNGVQALEMAAAHEPDMILLDIIMPGMDGYEVSRRLKSDSRLSDIPIVFVTALKSSKESRITALECGAEAFLTKPIDESELTAQIRAMLKIRKATLAKRDESKRLAILVDQRTNELKKSNERALYLLEELKGAYKKREQSERSLLEAQELALMGSFEYDMVTKRISCTDTVLQICNFTREAFEVNQSELVKLIYPDDMQLMIEMINQAIATKGAVEFKFRLLCGEPEPKHIFMRVRPEFDATGTCIRATGVVRDITRDTIKAEQLKQNLKDLTESQQIAHVGTWRLDLNTNQVVWSNELYKMFGLDPSQPPPPLPDHAKLFSPSSWYILSAALERAGMEGAPYELELQTVRADGTNGWMWVRGEAERDDRGQIVSIWGAAQDISHSKKIETELRESQERFQLLFNKAPLGYQSLDANGRFIEVNQQWLDTLGYSREEVIGKWFGDFLCPEYVAGFRERFPIFKAQGYIHSEFEMMAKNGNRLYMAFEGKIGYDVGGNFVQTHCILKDITDQRKAEAALKESEFAERLLLDHLQVAIVVHNTDSSISFCNPLAEQILGISKNQIQNKLVTDKDWHFCDLFGEPLMIDAYPFSLVYQSDEALVDYEVGIVFESSGNIRWVMVNGFNIKDTEGNISKVLISFVDTTEKKAAEQALIESETRYKYLFENSGVGIGYYTTDGVVISYNKKALENIGGKLEDFVGKSIQTLFPQKEADIYFARIKTAVASDAPQQYEDYLAMGDSPKWFSSTFTRITNASGEVIGVQIASLDITNRMIAEEALSESQALLNAAFENSQAGIAIADAPNGKLRYVNKAGLLIRNKSEEEIVKHVDVHNYVESWQILHFDGTAYKEDEVPLARAVLYGDTCSDEFIIRRDDHEDRYVLANAGPIKNSIGDITAGVVVFLDITDKRKAEEEINFLAYHDHLTSVHNRRFFEDEFVRMNAEANFPLAIITGDLNGLKLINDSIGHAAGDQAIRLFASALQDQIRDCDILSRIGGDEFGIILPTYTDEEAKALLSRLQSTIRIEINDSLSLETQIELSATFGYSVQSFIGQTLDSLMNEAETFMYRRKFYDDASKHSHVIDAIMNTLFEKSVREQQHSIRVSILSAAIADAMQLDETTVAKVKAAGALHDIGKIGIDERILNKTESLTEFEWNLMKQHPVRSARILATIDAYLDIVPFVKSHHERYDGLGYPSGLTSTQIPLEARIISVADAFDAMTKVRSYRAPMNREVAAEELNRCAGSQFDPHIVEVFTRNVLPKLDTLMTAQ